jgi:hypothetical protein
LMKARFKTISTSVIFRVDSTDFIQLDKARFKTVPISVILRLTRNNNCNNKLERRFVKTEL